ncbi:MAG: hypothetical protein CK424_07150 [Legionella sp.]|nr:MAG: hypothetical protein CK424_07150 [Legionella sp.]
MLFIKPKENDEKKQLTETEITISSIQPLVTDSSTTWLSELGCHINDFYGISIVENSANISVVGTLQENSQLYWYSNFQPSRTRGFLAHYNQKGDRVSAQILNHGNDRLELASIITNNNDTFVSGVISDGTSNNGSIWAAKFNLAGDLLWAKELGGTWSNGFSSVHMTVLTKNHYAIISTSENSGVYALPIYNLDDNGQIFWEVAIKNDLWQSMGAYAITSGGDNGETSIIGWLNYDCGTKKCNTPFIALFSKEGELLNSKQFFLSTVDNYQKWGLTAIKSTYDHGYFAAGANDCNINECLVTLRMNSNGQPLSATQFFFDDADEIGIAAIALATNANYAIVGKMYSGGANVCLIGLVDDVGEPIWMTVITHARGIVCIGITNSRDGGFLITGTAQEKAQKNPVYIASRAITIKINSAGFADLPSGFTYYNYTDKWHRQPLLVNGTDIVWTTESQPGNALDITSSLSILNYADFCTKPQTDYKLLGIFLSVLVTIALCRLGWQDEKRKVKAPWQDSTSDNPATQQKKQSIDSRKSSLSGGLFGRRYERFTRDTNRNHAGSDTLSIDPVIRGLSASK